MPRLTREREAVIRERGNDTSAINYHIVRELPEAEAGNP